MGEASNIGAVLGAVSAGLLVALAMMYRAWSRLRLGRTSDETEDSTLKLLSAAVEHWKALHDAAWEQVKKERQLREEAEARASSLVGSMERLRSEVAALERKVDALTFQIEQYKASPA